MWNIRSIEGVIVMQAIALGCALDVERGPDWLLVRIRDLNLTDPDGPPLAEQLWSLMQQHFTHRLVLELDGTETLNSHLVGQLADLYRRIAEHDGVMRLCGLSPRNRAMLHACRLDEQLLPYQDRQEAVMGCPHSQKPR
jgi:anti-anti-sigma regulatory factor